jgi:hypothetical protein
MLDPGANVAADGSNQTPLDIEEACPAIVTGASGGIGHAIAERLAEEGAAVVVSYGTSADNA